MSLFSREKQDEISVRTAYPQDVDVITSIDAKCCISRWSKSFFLSLMERRTTVVYVGRVKRKVVGFMVLSLEKDQMEIIRVAVDPNFRRRGVGARLLARVKKRSLNSVRCRPAILVAEDTELWVHQFLKASEFTCVEVLDGNTYRFAYP